RIWTSASAKKRGCRFQWPTIRWPRWCWAPAKCCRTSGCCARSRLIEAGNKGPGEQGNEKASLVLELDHQCIQHSAYFGGELFRGLVCLLATKSEVVRDDKLRLQFTIRSSG